MAWFLGSRRGPDWKHGWRHQTLSSISLPPSPLLAIFAILILLLTFSRYMEYKTNFHQTMINFQFIIFLTPLLLILVIWCMSSTRTFLFRLPRSEPNAMHQAGGSPWGVALLVVVMLVMISYQSSFHSQWFRPLWRSD